MRKGATFLLPIAVCMLIAASGCGQTTSGEAVSAVATSPSVAAQGSARGAWGACTTAKARQAFAEFLTAFDRGDLRKLDSLFARQPAFSWYSSGVPGSRSNRAAERRDTLVAYFRARHLNQDRLRPVEIGVNTAAPRQTGLILELRRSAADHRAGRWFSVAGKAGLVCHDGRARFLVVSLGPPGSGS